MNWVGKTLVIAGALLYACGLAWFSFIPQAIVQGGANIGTVLITSPWSAHALFVAQRHPPRDEFEWLPFLLCPVLFWSTVVSLAICASRNRVRRTAGVLVCCQYVAATIVIGVLYRTLYWAGAELPVLLYVAGQVLIWWGLLRDRTDWDALKAQLQD